MRKTTETRTQAVVENTLNPRVESALRESEIRYRRLFESAKDGILILNAETGEITDVNPFLQAMLGYSHAELLGKALWEIGPFKDVVASREAFRELQVKEYVRYDDLPLETREHEHRHVEFVSNVYLADGVKVIQCNIRDITARKESDDRARRVNDDLLLLVAELQKRDREMQVLSEMSELLQSCTTQDEAFQVIGLKAGELFPGHSGCLAVVRVRDKPLESVAQWGPREEQVFKFEFSLDDCWALRRGHPHEIVEPHLAVTCKHFVTQPATGYLCIPLIGQGETLGVLCLIGAASGGSEAQLSLLHMGVTVGETIKLVLSNLRLREKLHEQANRDALTGLFNRRYLDDSLPRELSLSLRRKTPLSVALLDLDQFKRFNDRFGHEAGDLALMECARVLSGNLRQSDIACRLGGEEFVLVLPDSNLVDTCERVEQICNLIRKLEIRQDGQLLDTITMSAGIASAPGHASTDRELLRAADEALYAAKKAGRDRVVQYEPAQGVSQRTDTADSPSSIPPATSTPS